MAKREHLCDWADCTNTLVHVTISVNGQRPTFCGVCHAALWLLNDEGHAQLAREIEARLKDNHDA